MNRHNCGKLFLETFLKNQGFKLSKDSTGTILNTPETMFVISNTYMNTSGKVIKNLNKKYQYSVRTY